MVDSGPLGEPRRRRPRSASGRSGFRTFLRVLAVVVVVAVVTCGGAFYLAMQNPTVREFVDAAMESTQAPGSEELREAGCSQAAVLDLRGARQAMRELGAGEQQEAPPEDFPLLLVSCQMRSAAPSLDCDDVARVYLGAVGDAGESFIAQVSIGISGRPQCQTVYSATGRRLGPLEDFAPGP